jgi:osmotically inducible protein OsmC
MIEKTASVHWEGPGKKGKRQINTESSALEPCPSGLAMVEVPAT